MKKITDFIIEAKKEVDNEVIETTFVEISDILNDLEKIYDAEAIRLVLERLFGAYINCDNGISKDASIAVGDAIHNIYNDYLK